MQMLSVKLGVATGLNLAQQCRWSHRSSLTCSRALAETPNLSWHLVGLLPESCIARAQALMWAAHHDTKGG